MTADCRTQSMRRFLMTVGAWFIEKYQCIAEEKADWYRRQKAASGTKAWLVVDARSYGIQHAARLMRKQGVPINVALMVLARGDALWCV